MNQADRIREFAFNEYIAPARQAGEDTVTIRAGDIHKAMALTHAMPAVCGAIGALKFQHRYDVELISRLGPGNGANAQFTFRV